MTYCNDPGYKLLSFVKDGDITAMRSDLVRSQAPRMRHYLGLSTSLGRLVVSETLRNPIWQFGKFHCLFGLIASTWERAVK
jgi:hypothetical protein